MSLAKFYGNDEVQFSAPRQRTAFLAVMCFTWALFPRLIIMSLMTRWSCTHAPRPRIPTSLRPL